MKQNVGGMDRILRLVAGAVLIVWAALLGGPVWAWVGIVPLATGALGFCPLYPILGINTACCKGESCDKAE